MSARRGSFSRKRARSFDTSLGHNFSIQQPKSKVLKRGSSSTRVEMDFFFYICMVLDQSSATKFNALAMFKRFQQKSHKPRTGDNSLYMYACIVISSKFFENTPYQLNVRNVWNSYLKGDVSFSYKDLRTAEWECLILLDFSIDCRMSSPYFWAIEMLETSEFACQILAKINSHTDVLLSLALLRFQDVTRSDFRLLDAMALYIAVSAFESESSSTSRKYSAEITEKLAGHCDISTQDLVSSANQMLDELMNPID